MSLPYTDVYHSKEQRFNDKFPLSIVAVLAIAQMILTTVIAGLEIGHILYSLQFTNLFVGFWVSIPFTILWISMFATVCCCRRRSCATHAVVQNIISFMFAIALIVINSIFIRRPDHCFFSDDICNNLSWDFGKDRLWSCLFNDYSAGCQKTRLALIIAQLVAGIVMVITCFIYLILYGVVASQASRAVRQGRHTTSSTTMAPVYHQSVPSTIVHTYQPYRASSIAYQQPAPLFIPNHDGLAAQQPTGITNVHYLSQSQLPTIYPQILNDRF